jgi:hypothetical protein
MTEAEWKKAFHRLCVIEEYGFSRPDVPGSWAGSKNFDVEANAKLLLDDEFLVQWFKGYEMYILSNANDVLKVR